MKSNNPLNKTKNLATAGSLTVTGSVPPNGEQETTPFTCTVLFGDQEKVSELGKSDDAVSIAISGLMSVHVGSKGMLELKVEHISIPTGDQLKEE